MAEKPLWIVYWKNGDRKCIVQSKNEEEAYKDARRFAGEIVKFSGIEQIKLDFKERLAKEKEEEAEWLKNNSKETIKKTSTKEKAAVKEKTAKNKTTTNKKGTVK